MEEILKLLPETLQKKLLKIPFIKDEIEEIRVRVNRPLEVSASGSVKFGSELVTKVESDNFLNSISQCSIYRFEEQLRRGYITTEGGHRIGLAGKVVLESGHVKGIREISSFNIRVAKQKIGVANKLVKHIYKEKWLSTCIIGAPQTGKTTLLRDIARIISQGDPSRNIPPKKVGIVDERSEIAGCINGIPQFDFGVRVDVLDGCPKAEGMMMLIRSMSPDVLIVDEVGRHEDKIALMEAVNAGVSVIMTAHGENLSEVMQRPILTEVVKEAGFQRFIELGRVPNPATIKRVLNGSAKGIVL